MGSKKRRINVCSMARVELSGVEPSLPATNEERVIDSFHRIPIPAVHLGKIIGCLKKEFVVDRGAANFSAMV